MDLDRKPESRSEWFKSLSDNGIEISKDKTDHVIFWIQEMESWFLKQPEAIERWAEDECLKPQTRARQTFVRASFYQK